ncbi:MAG: hypothetical protein U0263_41895 [Polyangiaceae bacterium]
MAQSWGRAGAVAAVIEFVALGTGCKNKDQPSTPAATSTAATSTAPSSVPSAAASAPSAAASVASAPAASGDLPRCKALEKGRRVALGTRTTEPGARGA